MDEAITEVSICNSALIKLGTDTISSLTQDTKNARLCNARFAFIRNKVLEDHPWGFATKFVELASVSVGSLDLNGWGYAYNAPADFLRVQRGEDWDEQFDTVDNYLLADVEPFKLKYTAKVTNTGLYSYSFAECLSWRIAADLAYAVTRSREVAETMMRGFEMDLKAARYSDSHKKSPEGPYANTWIDARN